MCAVYGEGAVTEWTCQSGFVKFRAGDFLLEDASQLGRPVEVNCDQIRTDFSNWDNWEQSMLYHAGDSWCIQNIQINKVIGENEKCVLFYREKMGFWANPI